MPATILVAEDEPVIRDLLAAVLADAGYRVLRAADGAEALARLARDRPDLLLTDDRMPSLRGVDLIARLHAALADPIPVILMSAAERAAPPGIPFLAKPFDVERLLAAVAAALVAARARREGEARP